MRTHRDLLKNLFSDNYLVRVLFSLTQRNISVSFQSKNSTIITPHPPPPPKKKYSVITTACCHEVKPRCNAKFLPKTADSVNHIAESLRFLTFSPYHTFLFPWELRTRVPEGREKLTRPSWNVQANSAAHAVTTKWKMFHDVQIRSFP